MEVGLFLLAPLFAIHALRREAAFIAMGAVALGGSFLILTL